MNSQRGASLVELLIVLALISMMLLVAATLVIHSVRLLGATGRSSRNPVMVHITALMRRDITSAVGLISVEESWTEDPLVLRNQDGLIISYSFEGGILRRVSGDGMSPLTEERDLLSGVTAWWWKSPVPGVVDVQIGYLVNPEPEKPGSRVVGLGRVRRSERFRFALRSAGGGQRW